MFGKIALVSTLLALCVIVLGAYVRLSHAGLGCPDWPGCYGHWVGVPESSEEIHHANQAYPQRAVETDKAWKEMIHRYLAGVLGLLIFVLTIMAIKNRADPHQPVVLPVFLTALVLFQALLGMWTVTLLLKPVIVMLHLLGGLSIVVLLWWLVLKSLNQPPSTGCLACSPVLILGLLLLLVQIILGGWTSANYAALACPDFPTCRGQWWPESDFKEGFVFWRELGRNYEFGVLDNPARTAIHMSHRLFALVVAVFWTVLLLRTIQDPGTSGRLRLLAATSLLILLAQIALGISSVMLQLPIGVAVLHNCTAALLLLSVVTLIYYARLEIKPSPP